MANALYDAGKDAILTGGVDFVTDTIKAVLVDDEDYTPNLATDANLIDIPVLGRVATETLTNRTVTAGVFDADDTNFVGVVGDTYEYLVIYKDTGVEATSTLIILYDSAPGMPNDPTGGDILVEWDPAGILAL